MSLENIGLEMTIQDNRVTQCPLFVVQVDVEQRSQDPGYDGVELTEEFDLRPGVFFTAKACQDHINDNSYHYKNPRVYCISAWRNPEMQEVMKHLVELSGEKVPSCYL